MSFVFIHAYMWYPETHAEQDLLRFYALDNPIMASMIV